MNAETGAITYVSEKDGTKRHYANLGTTNKQGKFVTHKAVSAAGDSILSFRFKETDKSTISSFVIPQATPSQDMSSYFLEPKGAFYHCEEPKPAYTCRARTT